MLAAKAEMCIHVTKQRESDVKQHSKKMKAGGLQSLLPYVTVVNILEIVTVKITVFEGYPFYGCC
jgi:hypothetical protein